MKGQGRRNRRQWPKRWTVWAAAARDRAFRRPRPCWAWSLRGRRGKKNGRKT